MLTKLSNLIRNTRRSRRRRRQTGFVSAPAAEHLEQRALLAASMGGGILHINPHLYGSTSVASEAGPGVVVYTEYGLNPGRGWQWDVFQTAFGGVNTISFNGTSFGETFINSTSIMSIAHGNGGADQLRGGSGFDQLIGGDGPDRLEGGGGDDVLIGGAESDTYVYSGSQSLGFDVIFDNEGYNKLDFSRFERGVRVDLTGYRAMTRINPNLPGYYPFDTFGGLVTIDMRWASFTDVIGSEFADTILGSGIRNRIEGGGGNDTIHGSGGSDTLRGGAGDDTISGGSGIDYLYGGEDNDLLRGGSGMDFLYGEGGNDRLYGGAGFDHLWGGTGNDGLFGGGHGEFDMLFGQQGADRFLVQAGDFVADISEHDAKINFENGERKRFNFSRGKWTEFASGQFSDREIEQVDEVLMDLHNELDNTRLLKTESRGELAFQRLGPKVAGNFNAAGINSGGRLVTLVDASFGDPDWLAQVVFHEIGHNWDDENDRWDDWKDISGWDGYHHPWESTAGLTESADETFFFRTGTVFARSYGTYNPKEDYATYFAKYMMDKTGRKYNDGGGKTNSNYTPASSHAVGFNSDKNRFMREFLTDLLKA